MLGVSKVDAVSYTCWYVIVQGPKLPSVLALGLGNMGKINNVVAAIPRGLLFSRCVCVYVHDCMYLFRCVCVCVHTCKHACVLLINVYVEAMDAFGINILVWSVSLGSPN